jgi:hypothetical protein
MTRGPRSRVCDAANPYAPGPQYNITREYKDHRGVYKNMDEFRRKREDKKRRQAMKDAPEESESFHAGPVSVKPVSDNDSDDSDTEAKDKVILLDETE